MIFYQGARGRNGALRVAERLAKVNLRINFFGAEVRQQIGLRPNHITHRRAPYAFGCRALWIKRTEDGKFDQGAIFGISC